jgi:hypothetical protein
MLSGKFGLYLEVQNALASQARNRAFQNRGRAFADLLRDFRSQRSSPAQHRGCFGFDDGVHHQLPLLLTIRQDYISDGMSVLFGHRIQPTLMGNVVRLGSSSWLQRSGEAGSGAPIYCPLLIFMAKRRGGHWMKALDHDAVRASQQRLRGVGWGSGNAPWSLRDGVICRRCRSQCVVSAGVGAFSFLISRMTPIRATACCSWVAASCSIFSAESRPRNTARTAE